MQTILRRKQSAKNKDWLEVIEKIGELVPKQEIDALVLSTVEEIKATVKGKKAAYAWSAGKDSIVLSEICEIAGVSKCMMAICDLEYPEFLSWAKEHAPDGLDILNTGQDMEWLSKHPDMLFPRDSKKASLWFKIVQHSAQARYYKDNELDIMILGRRKADGNYVGRGGNIYTDSKGMTRYNPLSEWSHEAILAFIYYYDLKLPPIYSWTNGYLCGTHPWPARQHMKSEEQGWKEIYEIDRIIVENAASVFPVAKEIVDKMNRKK